MLQVVVFGFALAAWIAPLAVGRWAYLHSDRRPLLVIPMALVFIPLGSFAVAVVFDLVVRPDNRLWLWLWRVPWVATMLVVALSIRRLEQRLA